MNTKIILISIILILSVNNVNAENIIVGELNPDGLGCFSGSITGSGTLESSIYYHNNVDTTDYYIRTMIHHSSEGGNVKIWIYYGTAWGHHTTCSPEYLAVGETCYQSLFFNTAGDVRINMWGLYGQTWNMNGVICISDIPFEDYTVSGNIDCIDSTKLYIKDNNDVYTLINTNTSSSYYSFDVLNDRTYKLVFSDDHEYEFTVDGTNINYDREVCNYITMNFYDRCETPVNGLANIYWSTTAPNAEGVIVDGHTWEGFLYGGNVEIGDNIYLILTWYNGNQYYTYTATESPQEINITNLPIYYEMGVKTVTEGGAPISGVQVSVSQSCAYDGTKNKVTSGGWAWFTGSSNTGGSLTVSKTGYKSATMPFPTLMADAWHYRTSYIITLVASDSDNATNGDFNDTIVNISEVVTPDEEYDLDNNNTDLHDGVEIWFTNEDGNRCTKISDTDTYVDLWYINKNSNESVMTLEFQQSYTGNYYWDNLNWNIAYKKFGFKRIYNVNFTPYYYYYRGKIYNDELLQWDRIRNLDVRNETKEEEEHYENLSSDLWFRHTTVDHKIDYRNDIEIVCNAASNNTTLLDLDIELYNGSTLVDYINLTWADFSGASIKWFYIWEPDYNYASGYNYTAKMIGFDGYVLRTDHVDCFTEDRKNKLTINVKNQDGIPLDNCFIILEDWGTLPTASCSYNSYEGLDNGYYRYKATKPDYIGIDWGDITLSDSDEMVTYILTWSGSEEGDAMQEQKMSDRDLSNIYLILMAIVLIFIIFGGFMYAIK